MTPAEFAALAAVQLTQGTRILQATKGLWGFIPPKYQWVPTTLATAVIELTARLTTPVTSWLEVATSVVIVVMSALPGARSNVHAALQGLADKAANDGDNPLRASTVEAVSRGSMPAAKALTGFAGLIALALFAACCAPGCSSSPPKDPTAIAAEARKDARLTYAVAAVSLTALADAHAAWMHSLDKPTENEVIVAERVLTGLKAARAALDKARPWLENGTGDEASAKRALLDSLAAAETVADLLGRSGATVPPALVDGVEAARAALGGGR